jgi:hypothetical protein
MRSSASVGETRKDRKSGAILGRMRPRRVMISCSSTLRALSSPM